MNIYCHIGMPKAGSSSLQRVLGGLREPLMAQGYYYPPSLLSHTEYANTEIHNAWAAGRVGLAPYVRRARTRGYDKTILSSEFIYQKIQDYPKGLGAKIHQFCAAESVNLHMICVRRPAARVLKSMYKQQILNDADFQILGTDYIRTFEDGLERFENPSAFIRPFMQTLQPASLNMIDLGPDYIHEIMQLLGFSYDGHDHGVRENQSLPDVYSEIWRQFNQTNPSQDSVANFAQAVVQITGCNSEVLRRKTQWRKTAPAKISSDILGTFKAVENPPLAYTKDEFAAAIAALRRYPGPA